ncbi:MAG: cytochrome c3 family protein [Bryobacterales bacterium]|nr:cytochrome c3 family protein [Bryobacterales bacterium]
MRLLVLAMLTLGGVAAAQDCTACHATQVETRKEGKHVKVACDTCHGPQVKHAESAGKEKPAKLDVKALCLSCHELGKAKREGTLKVNPNEHYAGSACADCHLPHKPQT